MKTIIHSPSHHTHHDTGDGSANLPYRPDQEATVPDAPAANLPQGQPFNLEELCSRGFSGRDIDGLIKRGWLERLGRNVYASRGGPLRMEACVSFLARFIPGLHIGGMNALQWDRSLEFGRADNRINLWSRHATRLPSWFTGRFPAPYRSKDSSRIGLSDERGLRLVKISGVATWISVPERGLLEMLSDVGHQVAIEEAAEAMVRMPALSHDLLRDLLRGCREQKIVRLAYLLGSHAGHASAAVAADILGELQTSSPERNVEHRA